MWNIMFLGQKPIGELCFERLLAKQNDHYCIRAAVSNSDKNSVWWHDNKIYESCIKENIPFVDNAEKNESELKKLIIEKEINYIISVGHSWILSNEILQLVNYKAVNLHLAKLPDYKGNYTYNHAILNQEKEYGVTFHWMADKVDAGDYIFTIDFPINDYDTAYSLYLKSIEKGLELFGKFVEYLENDKELPRRKMERKGAFYSRRSLEGLREIKEHSMSEEIARKSRAFYFPPFENAYFFIKEKKYYVIPETN